MSEPNQSAPNTPTTAAQPPGSSAANSDQTGISEPIIVAAMNAGDPDDPKNPFEQVDQPAKVMRIGTMIKQLLDEVRNAPLDEKGRARLAEVHERSLKELEEGLSPDLVEELQRITLPFSEGETPSDAELRIAQAQLVGWLEGLFHGIQTALVAQQMAAQQQIAQMRRALPGGGGPGGTPGMPAQPGMPGQGPGGEGPQQGTGQYL